MSFGFSRDDIGGFLPNYLDKKILRVDPFTTIDPVSYTHLDVYKRQLSDIEKIMNRKYGDLTNPLLLSVRSGARKSMPGMMDTVLNLGLNDETVKGLIQQTGNERFAYDSYRRLVMMYADVVMEKAAGIEPYHGTVSYTHLSRAC